MRLTLLLTLLTSLLIRLLNSSSLVIGQRAAQVASLKRLWPQQERNSLSGRRPNGGPSMSSSRSSRRPSGPTCRSQHARSYEEVTTHGRAAESTALAGVDAADIKELLPGYVPLHARVREENARIREEQEKERPIIGLGRPLSSQPAPPVEMPATRLAATS